jgi:hypothetical protein
MVTLCTCVLLSAAVLPHAARARRELTLVYPYSRVWTSAVRLMRVDFEAAITEKDREEGYFLFEYPDRGKKLPGSMELVAVPHGEHEAVRVVLTIQALPSYVENMILDRLTKKLEQEFGPPKESKPPGDSGANREDPDAPADAPKPKPPAAPKQRPSGDKPVNRDSND